MGKDKLSKSISVDGVSYHTIRVTKYPDGNQAVLVVSGEKGNEDLEVVSVNVPRKASVLRGGEFFIKNNFSGIVRKLLDNGDIVLVGQSYSNGDIKVEVAKIA